ncbi:MAG: hypothetical protein KAY37_07330 [Phycisphaerae bacterium]|nr:hypothetical protein [Phycisphaerae bacterium]
MAHGNDNLKPKDVYETAVKMHQYFLNWRHRLFAGYLVILAAFGVAYSWASDPSRNDQFILILPALWLIPLLTAIVFWGLDIRNRDLYRACSQCAANCEDTVQGLTSECRIYRTLVKQTQGRDGKPRVNRSRVINHSRVIDFFYLAAILISAGCYYDPDPKVYQIAVNAIVVAAIFFALVILAAVCLEMCKYDFRSSADAQQGQKAAPWVVARSWIAISVSLVALLMSIFVAIWK